MSSLRKFVLAGTALLVSPAAVLAADMPAGFPVDETPAFSRIVSGWYVRGDFGYRFQQVGEATDFGTLYSSTSVEDMFMGGGGVGYTWNWLRVDVTGDYGGRSTLSGSTATGAQTFTASLESYSVMLNAYADLGTWWGITPYIGGGVGKARIAVSSYQTFPAQPTLTPPAHSWNNAWAVMAGFGYNLTDNLVLDVGYRHIDMGKVLGGLDVNQTFMDRLTGDEIRIGLRYTIE